MTLFEKDVIDLFSKKRGGHVEHWLYSDTLRKNFTGSQLWQEFLRASTEYYVLNNEVQLIKNKAAALSSALPVVKTVVDFGVGSGAAIRQKVSPLLSHLKTVQSYIGVDISADFLKNAKNIVADNFSYLNTQGIHADFFEKSFALPKKNVLGVMLGCTISNMDALEGDAFPRSHIVKRLSHLKDVLGKNNHLLVSYDANTDVKSILSAYSNEYWGRHVTGIMYDVAPMASSGFSASDWKHTRVWNDKAHVLHQCAETTKDMSFSVLEKEFSVSKGKRFVTVNNFKFPKSLFQALCDEAGFEVKESFADPQNRMQLQLLGT